MAIAFNQLRISSTVGNGGIEAYTDGSLGEQSIRVATSGGLNIGTSGVQIDPAGTVTYTTATHTFNAGATLSVVGSSFSGTEVVNADFVLSQSAAGVAWSFPVLSAGQLDDANDAVSQAGVFFLQEQPTSSDTLSITDGSTTRTYGFGAGGDVTVTIGATVDDTLANLASSITGDGSGLWDADLEVTLQSINDGTGSVTAGYVVVVYRANQSAASFDDRMFGSFTTGVPSYVNYNGLGTYSSTTVAALPGADPAQKEFGPGQNNPSQGEAHVTLDDDSQYVYDADGTQWVQISGTGSITAGTGLTKSGNTVHVGNGSVGNRAGLNFTADDVAFAPEAAGAGTGGLAIVSDAVRVNLEAAGAGTGGLELTASGLAVDVEAAGAGTGGLSQTATGLRVLLEAAGVGTGGLELTASGLAVLLEAAGAGTGGLAQTASGLAVDVGTSLELTASGVDLIDDAITLDKLGVSFREESFTAGSFSFGAGVSTVTLGFTPLVDVKINGFTECYRNGVADLTNTGVTAPSTQDEFRITAGPDELAIGADITGSGNVYKVRYMSATLT